MAEFFIQHFWLLWMIITIVCLSMEMTSGDFFLTCFALGGLVTALVAVLHVPFWVQVLVFAIVSMLSIWLLRPRIIACVHDGKDYRISNADAIIGRIGVVTEDIMPGGYGRVKIDGDYWKAQSDYTVPLPKGLKVLVIKRDSIIIDVKPV